jgi:hypothetical protein
MRNTRVLAVEIFEPLTYRIVVSKQSWLHGFVAVMPSSGEKCSTL